jgi:hypothetical protein
MMMNEETISALPLNTRNGSDLTDFFICTSRLFLGYVFFVFM